MSAVVLSGTLLASNIKNGLKDQVADLKKSAKEPCLATILVGEDPASQIYVASKARQCKEIGMRSVSINLDATVSEKELLDQITTLNQDPSVAGILVQMPLPAHIQEQRVIDTIDPEKDVDGFHTINVGRLQSGIDGLRPCTPLGCMLLIRSYREDISGLNAVVVGRSNIVGKPVAAMLLAKSATVTVAHSKTADLAEVCSNADILVAAVGKPEMILGSWIKPGAIVIDVGINRIVRGGKKSIVGDVDYAGAEKRAAAITPVPGGVGPMTICCLLENTVKACRARLG